ncbi:MAG TPA: hypothetical protein VGL77_02245 [Armatimonadota bacterium]|jgi:hypothetical protein
MRISFYLLVILLVTMLTETIAAPINPPVEAIPFSSHVLESTAKVLTIIPRSSADSVVASPHGLNFACVIPVDNRWRVISNSSGGQVTQLFDAIVPNSLHLSAGGAIAYVAEVHGKSCLVFNGKVGQPFDEIMPATIDILITTVGYFARSGNRWFVVATDGPSGKSFYGQGFEMIRADGITRSANHYKIAVMAQSDGKWAVANNGAIDQLYDDVRDPCFWPDQSDKSTQTKTIDRQRMVHTAKVGAKWRLVVVQRGPSGFSFGAPPPLEGAPTVIDHRMNLYDGIGTPVVSPNSSCVVYPASLRGKWGLMTFAPPPYIPNGPEYIPTYAPDGRLTGQVRNSSPDKTNQFDVEFFERAISKPFDYVGTPVFSQDSMHLAYPVRLGANWSMVLDEKPGDPFDEIGTPIFSIDGDHLAYTARKGTQWCVVSDGKAGSFFETVGTPVVSSKGEHVAYAVQSGKQWCMVRDGKIGKTYDQLGIPVFTPKGIHCAYTAKAGDNWRVVCEDLEGPPCVTIVGNTIIPISDREPPRITPAGTIYIPTAFRYLAVRENVKMSENGGVKYKNGEKALEIVDMILSY